MRDYGRKRPRKVMQLSAQPYALLGHDLIRKVEQLFGAMPYSAAISGRGMLEMLSDIWRHKASAAELQRAMHDFVAAPSTVRIDGTWKKEPAIIYSNYDTHITVVCHMNGAFRTAMTLREKQAWHLWHDHAIGGG